MTCPVCHRTEIMPGCPNSTCPARERTLSAADFGPSELRLLEIGALQERVRVLEAERDNMRKVLRRIGRGAELQAAVMRDPVRHGGWHGAERVADAFDEISERALKALVKMAAADAELLEPLPPAPDCA